MCRTISVIIKLQEVTMKILSFDPSGNYKEGKGTSGYATSDDGMSMKLGDIASEGYTSRQAYWDAHRKLIESYKPDVVVIESYRLFGHKAKSQSGSSLETPQLIGYLEMICFQHEIPCVLQDPTTKSRHTDDVLVKTGVIEKKGNRYYFKGILTNLHQRDALRHNLFFNKYGRKKLATN